MANWDRSTSDYSADRGSPAIPAGVAALHPSSFILHPSFSARPFRIDNVAIDFPVVQAALSGYSDWPMRVIARRLGAAYTMGEVLLDKFIVQVSQGSKARRYIRTTNEEHPVGAQLMGAEPGDFPPAALKLAEAGFDVIDLNFGCPVKKVLGRCRGGFLLSTPSAALEIVGRVRDVLPPHIPLTVKMRRGLDDSQESRDNFFAIFDGAFRLGVAAITVHGRTVRQRYDGPSNWDFVREVKQHAGPRIVLGSGDLFTAEDCLNMLVQTGVDGVTAARGAIGNPWIFRQARALAAGMPAEHPSLAEQREIMLEHYRLAEATYGYNRTCAHMRKFGILGSRMHPQAKAVRADFVAVKTRDQWHEVVEKWYNECADRLKP
jgi:nifR3 family TIM-barrel protein